jgi:hypothetical protein
MSHRGNGKRRCHLTAKTGRFTTPSLKEVQATTVVVIITKLSALFGNGSPAVDRDSCCNHGVSDQPRSTSMSAIAILRQQ